MTIQFVAMLPSMPEVEGLGAFAVAGWHIESEIVFVNVGFTNFRVPKDFSTGLSVLWKRS
jgi:hypothetical protein